MEEIRRRLLEREVQGLEALFTLRAIAQQVDNTLNEWMSDTVGSVARYQILVALWATKGGGIPHKDIVGRDGRNSRNRLRPSWQPSSAKAS